MDLKTAMDTISSPVAAMVAGAFGMGTFRTQILGFLSKVLAWLGSPIGQAEIKDVTALAADLSKALKDAGHPEPEAVDSTVSGLLAQLPQVAPPTPPSSAPKIGAFIFLALLGASSLHAQFAASIGGLLGSSTWEIGQGGAWTASGSTVAGGELNLAYGSVTGSAFSPYFVTVLGAAGDNRNGNNYADLVLGAGPVVPGTAGIPLIVAADWRMFTGDKYPCVMLGTAFQFGQPFWVSK
jgi:hypothetical protein